MAGAFFDLVDDRVDGGVFRADPATGGPWNPALQHGGPPSALLVRCVEQLAARHAGDATFVAMRAAVEFVGAVPVADVDVSVQVVRAARSAMLVTAQLSVGERVCLQARVWLVRASDTTAVAPPLPPPASDPHGATGLGTRFPYGDAIEWQVLSGGLATPGPGRVWARPRIPLVAGETLSGLQRVSLIGDSASGISSELDWATWSFVNIDLDVHLVRPVEGEWVLLDAATTLGTSGAALARSTVSDRRGVVGGTAQTLVLSPR